MGPNNSYQYHHLREKWSNRHRDLQVSLWNKHSNVLRWAVHNLSVKQLVAGSLGGIMLLSQPVVSLLPFPHQLLAAPQHARELDKNTKLLLDLSGKIPSEVRPLTFDEEKDITSILSNDFGIRVTVEIEGKRLERNYGLIGAEQHLTRYPGDTMYTHFENEDDQKLYGGSGMAPGRSAWGYFVDPGQILTKKDVLREKYYIAVQTFLSPGFLENVSEYNNFFKYRKMLVVNPHTGRSLVADIADSGPSVWTGKHLGGSPEVMSYLERQDGSRKGPVFFFFIDDPDDIIPLGPISIR